MLDGPPKLEELQEMMDNEMQDDEEFGTPTGSKEDEFLGLPPQEALKMLDRDNKSKSAQFTNVLRNKLNS